MTAVQHPSRFTFLSFCDERQRMLATFAAQVDRVAQADIQAIDDPGVAAVWPQSEPGALTVARLYGSNGREVARGIRAFPTLRMARRSAASLIAAHDHLDIHPVEYGARWNWYAALFGLPVLVGTRWGTRDAAEDAAALALRSLPTATVPATATRLRCDTAGPLSIAETRSVTFSLPRRVASDSELPAPMGVGAGILG